MKPRLTIVGTGLIGASFALALRDSFSRICAIEPDPAHAAAVLDGGVVDAVVKEVAPDQDAVLLACPSNRIAEWVIRLADHPGTLFDTGSVKSGVLKKIRSRLGRVPEQFVPCHPIAGSERSGPAAADGALFRNCRVILTPPAGTDPVRSSRVADWWRAAGARVSTMDPEEHDRVYALTSHLPHLLAFTYLQAIEPEHLDHTGGGFRDFSRIGASDPQMWTAIFEGNRTFLLPLIDDFQQQLEKFRLAIERGDREECLRLIGRARALRANLTEEPPGD
ncbi:MAG: prephenate dehydrogenase/arogenate dehydrogenase family protein [Pseudomonadales bacterium]|nr:prephenate dehydrogenase/arogenate dehydrogenase family protein [Pseudomonadales bacterium]